MIIAKLVGHSNTKQIEKTYGHILTKYRDEQLKLSRKEFTKNNMITLSLKNNILKKEA